MSIRDVLLVSAGLFFLAGLLGGVWKYWAISTSPDARAPVYVDMTHRASLLYSFACVLLAELAGGSVWSHAVNLAASIVLLVFFAITIVGYAAHGFLRDTDNQLRRPHRLGRTTLPEPAMRMFMILLCAAEVAGFLVLFSGYVAGRS